jgi:Uma2 family endonuclease
VSVRLRRWTRREYYHLIETGVFGENDHVELIEGGIVQMSPHGLPHGFAVAIGPGELERAFGPGYHVRVQLPLSLGDASDPEPDFAVLAGTARQSVRSDSHPTSALSVVEVADSSLAYDRETKGSLYARAAIPEYWIETSSTASSRCTASKRRTRPRRSATRTGPV